MRRRACRRGHSLDDPGNVYVSPGTGIRHCLPCKRARDRGELEPATHCWAGVHDLTDPANVLHADGTTRCLPCARKRSRAYLRARRAAA